MKQIKLTQGQVAFVDDDDFEAVSKQNWYAQKCNYSYYANRWGPMSDGKRENHSMHRDILGAHKGQCIDHKDGNGLNNQRNNLRFCTISENGRNQRVSTHPSKHSVFKGVTWHKRARKWQAVIRGDNKKDYYLGQYDTEEEAAFAYNAKATELFGEFARLNFQSRGR